MIISTNNILDARKQINLLISKKHPIVIESKDYEFNRKILESYKIDVFLISYNLDSKDFMKQKNTQLNEYIFKLAKKNNTNIALDIDKLTKLQKQKKARFLARLMQDIKLINKIKNQIMLLTDEKIQKIDLQYFLISLGLSSQIAKKSFIKPRL